MTISLDKDYILPVELLQKNWRKASSVCGAQPIVVPIPVTSRNAKPGRRKKSIASASCKTGLCDDEQCDILSIGYTAEALFETGDSMEWV